jgi:hypothetical protein
MATNNIYARCLMLDDLPSSDLWYDSILGSSPTSIVLLIVNLVAIEVTKYVQIPIKKRQMLSLYMNSLALFGLQKNMAIFEFSYNQTYLSRGNKVLEFFFFFFFFFSSSNQIKKIQQIL